MNVIEAIRTKRAVREYSDDSLPDDVARAILHAGRRAPSARNEQPWHFIAVRDRSSLRALAKAGPYIGHVARAAMAVAILTPPPQERETIMFDAGQAGAYMQLAAWDLGVVSCLGTIYESDRARALLRYPTNLHLSIVIAFGYLAAADSRLRPPKKGGRRSLAEVVHWEQW